MKRRSFLQSLSSGALVTSLPVSAAARKPLRGVFPIAQTPFTDSDKVDFDALIKELQFVDRGGVHGLVWPQIASEWWTLTREERLAGIEALCSSGRKLKPAVVIGVQSPEVALAAEYARQAAKHGADAIISLPPPGQSDPKAILEYYQTIGKATGLPLIVQAVGSLSVDSVVDIAAAVPTIRAVKDEAGEPLMRIAPFREKTQGRLAIFTGNHGRTMIDEMMRGFAGTMPATPFADLYAAAWDLWHGGKKREAVDLFGRAAVLIQEVSAYGMESVKYLLCLRGVFTTYRVREKPAAGRRHLDETSRQVLREILDLMKPYLRA